MPIVQRVVVDQRKIRAGIKRAERALAPDVIRILYSYAENWQGEYSLFFRVVISDHAADLKRLRDTTQRIIVKVLQETKAEDLGLEAYFNFRSKSEQAILREPAWERQ